MNTPWTHQATRNSKWKRWLLFFSIEEPPFRCLNFKIAPKSAKLKVLVKVAHHSESIRVRWSRTTKTDLIEQKSKKNRPVRTNSVSLETRCMRRLINFWVTETRNLAVFLVVHRYEKALQKVSTSLCGAANDALIEASNRFPIIFDFNPDIMCSFNDKWLRSCPNHSSRQFSDKSLILILGSISRFQERFSRFRQVNYKFISRNSSGKSTFGMASKQENNSSRLFPTKTAKSLRSPIEV